MGARLIIDATVADFLLGDFEEGNQIEMRAARPLFVGAEQRAAQKGQFSAGHRVGISNVFFDFVAIAAEYFGQVESAVTVVGLVIMIEDGALQAGFGAETRFFRRLLGFFILLPMQVAKIFTQGAIGHTSENAVNAIIVFAVLPQIIASLIDEFLLAEFDQPWTEGPNEGNEGQFRVKLIAMFTIYFGQ